MDDERYEQCRWIAYVGAETIPTFERRAEFVQVSTASWTEGHAHDVMSTDEAPNCGPEG